MTPDTTHRLTRSEQLLYVAAAVAGVLISHLYPMGVAL